MNGPLFPGHIIFSKYAVSMHFRSAALYWSMMTAIAPFLQANSANIYSTVLP